MSEIYPDDVGPFPETITSNSTTINFGGNFYGSNDLAYVWNNWGGEIDGIESPPANARSQPLTTAYFGA